MIRLGFALAMTITLLAACGLKGELERPVPLFGNPPNEGANDPRTIKAREQAEAKRKADEEAAQRAARDTTNTQPAIEMPGRPQ
jgi:predicted small lipoprotein YifL